MPKRTRVDKCYKKLVKKGMKKSSAAAICTKSTGQVLATGQAAKNHGGKPVKKAKKK